MKTEPPLQIRNFIDPQFIEPVGLLVIPSEVEESLTII
jgi:hypothetical protein